MYSYTDSGSCRTEDLVSVFLDHKRKHYLTLYTSVSIDLTFDISGPDDA